MSLSSSTAPRRNPGAVGVKVTFTLQDWPAVKLLMQLPLFCAEKSRPVAPWVNARIWLTAVGAVKLKVTVSPETV